jgi:hypothetical protein
MDWTSWWEDFMVDPREVIEIYIADVAERLPLKGSGRYSRVNCTRFLTDGLPRTIEERADGRRTKRWRASL